MVSRFLWSMLTALTLKQWLLFGAAGVALLVLK